MNTNEILEIEEQEKQRDIKAKEESKPIEEYLNGRIGCESASQDEIKNHNKRIQHLNVLLETRILRYKSLYAEIIMLNSEVSKHNEAIDIINKQKSISNDQIDIKEYTDDI